jgi:septal ring factor EnvC (AmiA/AmiB activator)
VLTFRPQYAHYLVSKLVELQVDIEEKDDIIEKKDDIIERLKAEIEQLKRDNKQIIATVQEMTNCREESHAVSVTSEDNEAGDGEKDILCASLKRFLAV